ncbi:MAG: alkyl sulfatase C-terminal domain-containing protein, partial [Pseudomonadota bacterium]
TETVLDLMRARFRAEAADEDAFSIALTVSGEAAPHYLTVRNNTLFLTRTRPEEVGSTARINRETLNRIAARATDWRAAATSDGIAVLSGTGVFARFTELIE